MSAEMSGGARPSPAQAWVLAARPKTLPAACVPVIVGTGAAVGSHHFALLPALAALAGALLLQIGANFANDVFDFLKGADTHERLGPTRVTQAGLLTPKQVVRGMAVVFGVAILVGCYLVVVGGWPIVAVGLFAILAAIAYTGGPYPLGYNGLGEVFVFLFFGLAAVCGTYYVQASAVSPAAWGAAVPIGLLAVNILVVNNLRDIVTDTAAGKRTVAVRLGRQGTFAEYAIFLISAYITPLAMALLHAVSWWTLSTWLSLPLALRVWKQVTTVQGRALNPVLGATAQLELVYGILFALGLGLS